MKLRRKGDLELVNGLQNLKTQLNGRITRKTFFPCHVYTVYFLKVCSLALTNKSKCSGLCQQHAVGQDGHIGLQQYPSEACRFTDNVDSGCKFNRRFTYVFPRRFI